MSATVLGLLYSYHRSGIFSSLDAVPLAVHCFARLLALLFALSQGSDSIRPR